MTTQARLAQAITRQSSTDTPWVYAVWQSAEAVDANLSQVLVPGGGAAGVPGANVRFVPKLSHVTGLSAGQTVMCSRNPMTIIGIVVGNIALAAV